MASGFSNRAKKDLLTAALDLSTGTYKVMLTASTYVHDPDSVYVSAITGGATNYELNSSGAGSGYAAGYAGSGRKTLASLAVVQDDTNNRATWGAANLTWTAINAGTIGGAVIYKPNTNDGDSKIIAFLDLTDYVTNGGDYTLSFASGLIGFI